jgi:WD40 repeat protein
LIAVFVATRQARISHSRQLAAETLTTLGRSMDRALVLSAESFHLDANADTRSSLAFAMQASPRLLAFLHGNPASAWSVAWSDDSKTIAAGNADGTITFWDAESLQLSCRRPLTANAQPVRSVAFAPRRRVLASAGEDHAIHLWDADRCTALRYREVGHDGTIHDLAFSPDGRILASAGGDGKVRLWDGASLQPLAHPPLAAAGEGQEVLSVAFSADGADLASGDSEGRVLFWRTATWTLEKADANEHQAPVNALRFSPASSILASGSDDQTVALWDRVSRRTLANDLLNTTAVAALAFTPDGETLAAAGADGQIRLWNANHTSEGAEILTQHHAPVNSVAASPNGRWLVSSSGDGQVILWDMKRKHRLAEALDSQPGGAAGMAASRDGTAWAASDTSGNVLVAQAGRVDRFSLPGLQARTSYNGIQFLPDGSLAAASADATVDFWDARTGQPRGEPLRGHLGAVHQVAVSPDGDTLATAGQDGSVILWSVAAHRQLAVLRGHVDDVNALAFSPSGDRLASASDDLCVIVWDVRAHKLLARLLHTDRVLAVAYSGDGKLIAAGDFGNQISLWSTTNLTPVDGGTPVATFMVPDVLQALRFSPVDGRLLASLDRSGVLLWDTREPRPRPAALPAMTGTLTALAFSRDGKQLAVGGERIYLAQVARRTLLPSPAVPPGAAVKALAFDAVGALAAATSKQQLMIWEHPGVDSPRLFGGTEMASLALSPDGATLALGDSAGTITLWRSRSLHAAAATLRSGQGRVGALAFSGNGSLLASAGADKSVRLWRLPGGEPLARRLGGFDGEINAVHFNADRSLLAAADNTGRIRVWDAHDWRETLPAPRGHVGKVHCLAFNPADRRSLASGGGDRNIVLWDLLHELQPRVLPGHADDVTALAFSADGTLMASGGANRVIMLWDARSGERIGTWMFAPRAVKALAFLSSETLLSAGADRGITRWNLSTDHWQELAHRTANLPAGSGQ